MIQITASFPLKPSRGENHGSKTSVYSKTCVDDPTGQKAAAQENITTQRINSQHAGNKTFRMSDALIFFLLPVSVATATTLQESRLMRAQVPYTIEVCDTELFGDAMLVTERETGE